MAASSENQSLTPEEYDRFLSNIEHEDNLINHRLSWLLVSQSFLFGASVAANPVPSIIRIIGIVSALASYVGLVAAILSIATLSRLCEERIPDRFPPAVGAAPLHAMGLVAPIVIPPIFVLGWVLF